MKKFLFIAFLFSLQAKAQVVFCPPGAEWHYTFVTPTMYRTDNEQIKYVRDSVVDNETVKVLHHNNFYIGYNYLTNNLTLIKQKGDTVFMRNLITKNTWQILYNYAAQAGQSWETTIDLLDPFNSPPSETYTVTVDSVKYISVNSFNLKVLYVKYKIFDFQNNIYAQSAQITERFGSSNFMFSYEDFFDSDGDTFNQFLCYKDDVFGLKQFSSYACDYYSTAIKKNGLAAADFEVYPVPATEILNIKFSPDGPDQEFTRGEIINGLGQPVSVMDLNYNNKAAIMNVKDLPTGIYSLKLTGSSPGSSSRRFIITR